MLQHAATLPALALFNFCGSAADIQSWLAINDQLPVYFVITGLITEKSEKIAAFRPLLSTLPIQRLLIASDSPFYTPQNIDDVWIREQRNEPSNLSSVLQALAEARGCSKQELASHRTNRPLTPLLTRSTIMSSSFELEALFRAAGGG